MDELMGEPNCKEDQDRPPVHYAGCKQLFQDAVIAILKCLGFEEGAAVGLHTTSPTTPAGEKKDDGKNVIVYEEEKEAAHSSSAELDPSSLPTAPVRDGGDALSSAVDPPAAHDPPPSSTEESEVISRARRAPSRLPVRTGGGPQIN